MSCFQDENGQIIEEKNKILKKQDKLEIMQMWIMKSYNRPHGEKNNRTGN